jgi:hypothetical protein
MVRASALAKPACINPQSLYSAVELAAYLGIKPRTLEVWRRTGEHPELRYRRVGRRIRYLGRDILKFLNDSASPQPKRRRRGAR